MAGKWWNESWNPVTGCTACSEGCAHCYAKAMHERLFQSTKFEKIVLHPERLDKPSRMKAGKVIFVDSMSDLFHEDVPFGFIQDVFRAMRNNYQHTYVILTKRLNRVPDFLNFVSRDFYVHFIAERENIWFGTTVENQDRAEERIPLLLDTPIGHKLISVEPMLGPVELKPEWLVPKWDSQYGVNSATIQSVICGGESGTGGRPMQPDWARGVRDKCAAAGVPFYFKQWGEWAPDELDGFLVRSRGKGRMLDGVEWNELPWKKAIETTIVNPPATEQLELI